MRELPRESVRILVAPCGHVAGIDVTTEVPGFCRTVEEAEEDIGAGFTERRDSLDAAVEAAKVNCDHEPKWGIQ